MKSHHQRIRKVWPNRNLQIIWQIDPFELEFSGKKTKSTRVHSKKISTFVSQMELVFRLARKKQAADYPSNTAFSSGQLLL